MDTLLCLHVYPPGVQQAVYGRTTDKTVLACGQALNQTQ